MLTFPTTFSNTMLRSTLAMCTRQTDARQVDIFDHQVLLIPFECEGRQSLFFVLGAKYIKDYNRRGFDQMRPCILHIDESTPLTRSHKHLYQVMSVKIRAWLNMSWKTKYGNNDTFCMPFSTRSMPVSRPHGKIIVYSCMMTRLT